MQRSSALQNLETILYEASKNGNATLASGVVLLKTMNLDPQPENLANFYELLNKAMAEAKLIKIKIQPRLDDRLSTLKALYIFMTVNHLWAQPWSVFTTDSEGRLKHAMTALSELAGNFHAQNPVKFLEQDFLNSLNTQLAEILGEILKSGDLSEDLKNFLVASVEDLLSAVRRYYIDGTIGLEKSVKSLITDLEIKDSTLDKKGKQDPNYRRLKSHVIGLLLFLVPSNVYDLIGVSPYAETLVHEFGQLVMEQKHVEHIMLKNPDLGISEILKKALALSNGKSERRLEAKAQRKAISSAKEDSKNNLNSLESEVLDAEIVRDPAEILDGKSGKSLAGENVQKALSPSRSKDKGNKTQNSSK
jgi:hypothetical protein